MNRGIFAEVEGILEDLSRLAICQTRLSDKVVAEQDRDCAVEPDLSEPIELAGLEAIH